MAQPTGNMVKDARTTIKSIAADILQRNPQLKNDPATLMAAVNQTITSMKGLEPEMRDYMGLEARLAAVQGAADKALLEAKSREDRDQIMIQKLQTQLEIAEKNARSREHVAATQAGGRVESARAVGQSRENVAVTNQQGGIERERVRGDNSRAVANTRADASTSGARINATGGKEDAPAPRAGGAAPVRVRTPEEATRLKPGTHYVTPDGQELIR